MGKKKEFVSQEYSAEKGGKNLKEGTKKGRVLSGLATAFFTISVIVGVALISFSIVFFFSDVDGTSMMTTLNASKIINAWEERAELNTDSVIVNRYEKPKRGDIIVLKHYDLQGNYVELHIKRLIALGGESVYFEKMDDHYEIEIDGKPYEDFPELNSITTINGNNGTNIGFYNAYYYYQEHGTELPGSGFFNNFATQDKRGVDFRQKNTTRDRYEIVIPKDYFFYMGDNRGGDGFTYENEKYNQYGAQDLMSIDSTYFGPQPTSCIVGVVNEIIHEKTAPQWFWSKIVWIFSFKWI